MKLKNSLTIFFCCISLLNFKEMQSMEKTAEPPKIEINQEEIDKVVEDAQKTLKKINPDKIIKDCEEQRKKDKQEENKKLIEHIKDLNTIICGIGTLPIALYKGDLTKFAFFTAKAGFEYFLYKKIVSLKIDSICQHIISNLDELEKMFTDIRGEKVEKAHRKKNILLRMVTNATSNPAFKPLKEYLKKNHSYINYNPFKQDLILALLFNFFAEKIIQNIENNRKINSYDAFFKEEYHRAYIKDQNGRLIQKNFAPISAFTIFKLFLSPRQLFGDQFFKYCIKFLSFLNNIAELGLPKIIYSEKLLTFYQIIALGLSTKVFDAICTDLWIEHVIKNHKKFLKIIKEFKNIKRNDKEKLIEQEEKLKDFIKASLASKYYIPFNLMYKWFSCKSSAILKLGLIFSGPVLCSLAYKYKTQIMSFLKIKK